MLGDYQCPQQAQHRRRDKSAEDAGPSSRCWAGDHLLRAERPRSATTPAGAGRAQARHVTAGVVVL